MKIFVTNLNGFEQRKTWIQKLFGKRKLEFEFINCIDGRNWTDSEIRNIVSNRLFSLYQKYKNNWLTKGAIAATKTHLDLIYKNIIDENIDYALCCEDDIMFSKDFKKNLKDIEDKLYEINFEGVLLLHYTLKDKIFLSRINKIKINDKIQIAELNKNQKVASGAAYIISQGAAKQILSDQYPIKRIADWWQDHPNLKVNIILPLQIYTGVFPSTLGYSKTKYRYLINLIPAPVLKAFRMRHLKKQNERKIIY